MSSWWEMNWFCGVASALYVGAAAHNHASDDWQPAVFSLWSRYGEINEDRKTCYSGLQLFCLIRVRTCADCTRFLKWKTLNIQTQTMWKREFHCWSATRLTGTQRKDPDANDWGWAGAVQGFHYINWGTDGVSEAMVKTSPKSNKHSKGQTHRSGRHRQVPDPGLKLTHEQNNSK